MNDLTITHHYADSDDFYASHKLKQWSTKQNSQKKRVITNILENVLGVGHINLVKYLSKYLFYNGNEVKKNSPQPWKVFAFFFWGGGREKKKKRKK